MSVPIAEGIDKMWRAGADPSLPPPTRITRWRRNVAARLRFWAIDLEQWTEEHADLAGAPLLWLARRIQPYERPNPILGGVLRSLIDAGPIINGTMWRQIDRPYTQEVRYTYDSGLPTVEHKPIPPKQEEERHHEPYVAGPDS